MRTHFGRLLKGFELDTQVKDLARIRVRRKNKAPVGADLELSCTSK